MKDTQNFRIPSNGWQTQEALGVVNGKKVTIHVKINPEGDVWEYVDGVPAQFVGQQIFTYAAALRETAKVGKSLPQNQSVLEEIISAMPGETPLEKYKNYFIQSHTQLAGCYSAGSYLFDDIGIWAYYWLDDGSRLALNIDTRNVSRRDGSMGYSVKVQ